MQQAQVAVLPDGRLHLHHGPIDLIVGVSGAGRTAAIARVTRRFTTILQELVDELPQLRLPVAVDRRLDGPVARRMAEAAAPCAEFVTPMAAVAGAVADEMIAAIRNGDGIEKAYVNNGGDVAFHLIGGTTMTAAMPFAGRATIRAGDPVRGIATSGWRGRSHSLGIADSVTVLAATAAKADAAATLIANAVDVPGHSGIGRKPAHALDPDSDLGDRLVTTSVCALSQTDRRHALERGREAAQDFARRNLIVAAFLVLQGDTRTVGALVPPRLETTHA